MNKALVRVHEDGTQEVMLEPFPAWVQNNLPFLTGKEVVDENGVSQDPGDGWTLVENYEPPEPESEIIPEEADGEA